MKAYFTFRQHRLLLACALACAAAYLAAGSVNTAGTEDAYGRRPLAAIGAITAGSPPPFELRDSVMIDVRGKRESAAESAGPGRRKAARNEDTEGLPESGGPGTETLIRGRVSVTGNEPHTMVLLVDESTGESFAIIPEATMERMRNLQGELVDFTVRLLDESASGEGKRPLPARAVNPLSWKIVR